MSETLLTLYLNCPTDTHKRTGLVSHALHVAFKGPAFLNGIFVDYRIASGYSAPLHRGQPITLRATIQDAVDEKEQSVLPINYLEQNNTGNPPQSTGNLVIDIATNVRI